MNAWPAIETLVSDGWVFRFAGGYTRRANSVYPLYSPTGDLATKVEEAERLYHNRELPPLFKLTRESQPVGLEALLVERGYSEEARTGVHVADLAQARGCPIRIETSWDASEAWRDAFHRMSDLAAERRALHDRILEAISPPKAFASVARDGRIVGCALGVAEAGWLGVFDVVVDQVSRRQGHGECLMRGLLAWGSQIGAERSYLQVMVQNEPALGLYAKLGFREAYQYWYRVRRTHEATQDPKNGDPAGDYGFSYQATQGGDVLIRRDGGIVTRLRNDAARSFLADVVGAEEADAQETMARYTGNYKRGNERSAREHRRCRRRP